jgi:two-component system nitrogen regulation sensor histidine kinase NtrY
VSTDLSELLTDVLALYRGIFAHVELRSSMPEGLPRVSVDPEKIRRVMLNLIDNAVEAMEQRGVIDVQAHHLAEERVVRIVVADDGPGIPESERDKLFLPHFSTKKRGSGVGLAIVRRIVAEHGGRIDVSENVPRGTRFAIDLPC